jgi:LEA14-like dessication related protein
MKELEAEFSVRIKNDNSFGFTVTKSDLDLSLNGKKLGKVKLKDKVHVRAKSDDPHTFTIKSDLSESGAGGLPALLSIIQSRSPKVKLVGYLKVRSFLFFSKKIPVDIEQSIPLGK